MNIHWNYDLKSLRPLDLLAFTLSLGLTVLAAATALAQPGAASHLHIQTRDGEFVYDLSHDAELEFHGPLGVTRVEIAGGEARVLTSPCRAKICVNSRALSAGGDWTACLPNGILLRVAGEPGNGDGNVDAVSY